MKKQIKLLELANLHEVARELKGMHIYLDVKQREIAGSRVRKWLASKAFDNQYADPISPVSLEHYLSEAYAAASLPSTSPLLSKSLSEWKALSCEPRLPLPGEILCGQKETAFLNLLADLRRRLGLSIDFRSVIVGTEPDLLGNQVIYPHFFLVSLHIRRIFFAARSLFELNSSFAPIFLYVAILNLHPYSDGNGRLARALFNWAADSDGDHLYYCPLYECSAISRGGIIIRMRLAMYKNSWQPFIQSIDYINKSFLTTEPTHLS